MISPACAASIPHLLVPLAPLANDGSLVIGCNPLGRHHKAPQSTPSSPFPAQLRLHRPSALHSPPIAHEYASRAPGQGTSTASTRPAVTTVACSLGPPCLSVPVGTSGLVCLVVVGEVSLAVIRSVCRAQEGAIITSPSPSSFLPLPLLPSPAHVEIVKKASVNPRFRPFFPPFQPTASLF